MVDMVRSGFEMGHVEEFFTKTLIVLIPKVSGPKDVSHFRSISLCTIAYKVLMKVLVNRLKPVMPNLIVDNQKSFVEGHHIMDNVVIAQEVIHSMRVKKGRLGWMAIKTWRRLMIVFNGTLLRIRLKMLKSHTKLCD